MKTKVAKVASIALLPIAAFANGVRAPEIDPDTALSAVTLLLGALAVLIAIGLFVLIDWLLKLYMVSRDLRGLRMLNSEIRRWCITVDLRERN